jgi:hypothetical protein
VSGLIGFHITDAMQMALLPLTLQSIFEQSSPLDYFGLSWSCDGQYFESTQKLLTANQLQFRKRGIQFDFCFSEEKKSQMEHMEFLAQAAESTNEFKERKCWFIFGEPGHLWGNDRVRFLKTRRFQIPDSDEARVEVILPHIYYKMPFMLLRFHGSREVT